MIDEAVSKTVPVAIIGMGCMFPKAADLAEYWANIKNRVDAIGAVPPSHWRPEDYFDGDPKAADRTYVARGGFLSPVDFSPLDFGISPNALEATDTTQLLGLLVAKEALEDAGYGPERAFNRNRVSVILGVTGTLELVIPLGARLGHPIWRRAMKEAGVPDHLAQDAIGRIADSYVSWHEDSFPGLLGNVVAGRIANRLDLGGTNCVVDAACASSLSAVHLATLELAAGRADMVLTGGMDTFNDIFMYMCFSKTPALSPTGDARPFDANGDGTILGEGLGCLVLKRLADAERDGDRIYAVIRSVGTSSDGKGQAVYAPSPKGQAKALRQAQQLARMTPDTIELVEAHGTGTRAGDAAEVTALTEVFNGRDEKHSWCALGSVKSQIGHTKAAAGIAGLMKATMALHDKVVPPTIKVDRPIEQLTPGKSAFYLNTAKRPWLPPKDHPRRAGVSAFGFGGSNFHCILEEHKTEKSRVSWDGDVALMTFSGSSRQDLLEQVENRFFPISWQDLRLEAARSRIAFCSQHSCRLVVVLERKSVVPSQITARVVSLLKQYGDRSNWNSPDGVYFGSGPVAGKLAMLFPGQGSQYVGMMRDLACSFPQMLNSLADSDAAFTSIMEKAPAPRLSNYVHPHSIFGDEDLLHAEEALRNTSVAQPALAAISRGTLGVLQHFGIQPDATAGHSFGELVALFAAGWYEAEALQILSTVRGQAMAKQSGNRGAMLAVSASLAKVEELVRVEKLNLVIANKNGPNQYVLSGATKEIDRALAILNCHGISGKQLPVSAAFHSPLVAAAQGEFRKALETIHLAPSDIAVYANATAQEYPRDPEGIRSLLARQLAEPVEFIRVIENMYEAGIRTFLEVGPSSKLTGLVNSILEERQHHCLAVDNSSGKRSGVVDLARTLAELAALGHSVSLSKWDDGEVLARQRTDKKPSLTVSLCGANYVKPSQAKPPPKSSPGDISPSQAGPVVPVLQSEVDRDAILRDSVTNARQSAPYSIAMPNTPKSANGETAHVPLVSGDALSPRNSNDLSEEMRIARDNIVALQKLGEQTAQLHKQFLDGQDRALQIFQELLQQQAPYCLATNTRQTLQTADIPREIQAPAVHTENGGDTAARYQKQAIPSASQQKNPDASSAANGKLAAVDSNRIQVIVLEVVSVKTGYPIEMLDLAMEMDADLGIDSIKRVEILSVLQERLPEAPVVKAEHLGALRTLQQVIDFLADSPEIQWNGERKSNGREIAFQEKCQKLSTNSVKAIVIQVVAEKTGYPSEMLETDMEMDADLGIDSIKRVEILSVLQERLPEAPLIGAEHLATLRTLKHIIDFLSGPTPQITPEAASNAGPRPTELPATAGTVQKFPNGFIDADQSRMHRYLLVPESISATPKRPSLTLDKESPIWITEDYSGLAKALSGRLTALGYQTHLLDLRHHSGIKHASRLGGLVILPIASGVDDPTFLNTCFQLLRLAGPGLRAPRKNASSFLVTVARMDGAFGFTNWQRECEPFSGGLAGFVKTAMREWSEVQCKAIDLSTEVTDIERAAEAIAEEMHLAGPVEVGVSPKGRITLQLAESPQNGPCTGRSINPADVLVFSGGARGITAETAVALAKAYSPTLVLLGRSPEPSPEPEWLVPLREEAEIKRTLTTRLNGSGSLREVSDRFQKLKTNREILQNINRIRAAGAQVIYRQVDVNDPLAVRLALTEVQMEYGVVRGIIHGAGVLADRLIEDKTNDQFEKVLATKVGGLRSLLAAIDPHELKLLILFSSVTARWGRKGQVDYAVANEVLNKLAHHHANRFPECRVISMNWGPWDGGMVTPSLKEVFKAEGIELIPPHEGAEFLVQEIQQARPSPIEVVALAGPLLAQNTKQPEKKRVEEPALVFERQLSLELCPFLRSHVLGGRAVMPMAMIVEWLAHGALHAHPGLAFHGFNDLAILKGVRLEEAKSLLLSFRAGKLVKNGPTYMVSTEMLGRDDAGRQINHARAEMVLVDRLPTFDGAVSEPSAVPYKKSVDQVYRDMLFHGAHLQGIQEIEGCSESGIVGSVATNSNPTEWFPRPLRNSWIADPLALDCGFQLMVVWTLENRGAGSLPCFIKGYRQFRRSFPKNGVRVCATITHSNPQRILADLDFVDHQGELVARLEGYECVLDAALKDAFRRNRLGVHSIPVC
ncbi:MAG: SDR family NAD(P)-dependent oxidoreductase [Gemmataceae bacterium]